MINMLKLTKDETNFIKDNLENAEMLLQSDNVNDILDPLDTWILVNGFNDDYSLNDIGRKAQRMYDNIYLNNE